MDIIEKLKARKAVIHIRFGQQQHGILISEAERDALLALVEPQWQPIETAPRGRIVLMFGVTDRHEDGRVANWKKATGNLSFDGRDLTWDGDRITKPYQHRPTHWLPLPPSPPDEPAPPSPRPASSSETPETRA